jgi:hypothetical protein
MSRVLLSLIFSIIIRFSKGTVAHKNLNKILKFVSKGVFYNQILRISLEAYFEFYLISVMNIYTAEHSTNGEVLGLVQSYFAFSMIMILLPFLSLYILTKTIE